MQGHPHEIGTDFDVWLRNPDGSKGDQIYEAYYDLEYNFNQGYYDYAHPPVRTWEELFPVDMSNGMIIEASYQNLSQDTVSFGFTAKDEMHIMYFQYTDEIPNVSINDLETEEWDIAVYPVPARDVVTFQAKDTKTLKDASIQLFEIYGKLIYQQDQINAKSITLDRGTLSSGVYAYQLFKEASVVARGKVVFE
jgi:hypothetical protein